MRILLVDNYDSFTYNLLHYLEKVSDTTVDVVRNDKLILDNVGNYERIVLSPGPGLPEEAGLLMPLINRFKLSKKILGVCLGHQAIASSYNAKLTNLEQVVHGEACPMHIRNNKSLFEGLPKHFNVGRYHSWVVKEAELPKELTCLSSDENGNVMAFQHQSLPLFGVQFHPESILTEYGLEIIKNWMNT